MATKVEPKFHEGEWLCENEPNNYARFIQILEVVNVQGKERYRISRDLHNDEDVVEYRFIENNYHSFTIQDAKDGDVLAVEAIEENYQYSFVAIYKERGLDFFNSYCFIGFDGKFYKAENGHSMKKIHPATKEQRDQLERAMTNAGYKWDADKKELKKIEQKPAEPNWVHHKVDLSGCSEEYCKAYYDGWNNCNQQHAQLKAEQKPAWSERDERAIHCLEYTVKHFYEGEDTFKWWCDWLKSIKDRVQSQPKQVWKPTDEQMEALQYIYRNINPPLSDKLGWNSLRTLELMYQELKKLMEK